MRNPLMGATVLVLVAAVNLSSARARGRNQRVGPRGPAYHNASSTTLCPRIRQTRRSKDRDPRAQARRASWTCLLTPETAAIKPHYEWQYHYAGRHAYWDRHRVLVMAPIQSAARAPSAAS
jgi:hypothetical protein